MLGDLTTGTRLFDINSVPATTPADSIGSLAATFGAAPFSVLNAREGWWQDRKRDWIGAYGIRSEEGREARAYCPHGDIDNNDFSQKLLAVSNGQSVFDPVLTELIYRWFTPAAGTVLDPFAGGSVRGIVAGALGRQYVGIDLSSAQVAANRTQAEVLGARIRQPDWRTGNSGEMIRDLPDQVADLVFTCPPYYDLEEYSDDPRDLSAMGDSEFEAAYSSIIHDAASKLRPDRFSIWVVGDVRDRRHRFYRDLPGLTIGAHRDAGMPLYNTAVLVTAVGTLALRAGRQFEATRKLGSTHQLVLMFVKGDPAAATAACDPNPARAIHGPWT